MIDRPTIGYELWSTKRGWRGVDDAGQQIAPYCGVCVAVTNAVDEETGELVEAYTIIDSHYGHFTRFVLTADEIDPDVRPASDTLIADTVFRLARQVANRRQAGAKRLHQQDVIDVHDMGVLVDLLIERHGPAHYQLDTLRPAKPAAPREPLGPPNVKGICG